MPSIKAELHVSNINSTKNLTGVDQNRSIPPVAVRFKDVVSGMAQQASSETDAMQSIQDELTALRPGYQRYRELTEELRVREERARITAGLFAGAVATDADAAVFAAVIDKLKQAGLSDVIVADEAPLWKILREVLRQVPEMQVIDLEHVLRDLGLKTTRQAIDSAIAAHNGTFIIRKRGREKFISLKGV